MDGQHLGVRVLPQSRAAFARLGDGEAVIVDTETAFYFGLNRTAAFMWERLSAEGGSTATELAQAISERFEVGPAQAEQDAREFIERLLSHGLAKLNKQGAVGD